MRYQAPGIGTWIKRAVYIIVLCYFCYWISILLALTIAILLLVLFLRVD